MTDTLLFLHLLSAAALFAAVVCFSAVFLGAQVPIGVVRSFGPVWNVGLLGVLVFGLALAIDIDAYDPWDVWVLIAIGLWLAAGGIGDRLAAAAREARDGPMPPGAARLHWVRVGLVVLMLADMIWKPWA